MQTIAHIALLFCITLCMVKGQEHVGNTELEDTDAYHCVADVRIEKICLKCSSLPFYAIPSLDVCCSEKSAFLFCEACVNDEESCETLMKEIEDVDTFSKEIDNEADFYDDIDGVNEIIGNELNSNGELIPIPYPITTAAKDKRFGKLFVNRSSKRYGRIFFGKRNEQNTDDNFEEMKKRFGRLYMGSGSYFGKRSNMDKRYGRLFTSSNNYFGKRVPNLEDGAMLEQIYGQDEPDALDISKRYGRLYMGSRNKMYGKRYGRIFFGKRSNDGVDKRYGQLNLGRNGYFMRNPTNVNIDKRFGRLFTGRRKYYFGK